MCESIYSHAPVPWNVCRSHRTPGRSCSSGLVASAVTPWSYPDGHALSNCSISGTSFLCLNQGLEVWSLGMGFQICHLAHPWGHLKDVSISTSFLLCEQRILAPQTSSASPRSQCVLTGVTTNTSPVLAAAMAVHWLRCWGRVCGVGLVEKRSRKKWKWECRSGCGACLWSHTWSAEAGALPGVWDWPGIHS